MKLASFPLTIVGIYNPESIDVKHPLRTWRVGRVHSSSFFLSWLPSFVYSGATRCGHLRLICPF